MSIQVFVLSHDRRLLADVPRVPGLTAVDLEDLGLPARMSGQELSETRFFLTDFLADCDAEWIGLITGRWNDKFRCWPSLAQLPSFVAAHMRRPDQVIAPATFWWPAIDLKRFATRLDARYPGMGRMLEDPGAPAVAAVRSYRMLHPLVFNNNLIAHRDLVVAWIDFIQASFAYYDQRYGLDLPFDVRCDQCGALLVDARGRRVSHPGVSYFPHRHAAYFYEQVGAKFFIGADVIPLAPNGQPWRPPMRKPLLSSAFWRLHMLRGIYQGIHGTCQAEMASGN